MRRRFNVRRWFQSTTNVIFIAPVAVAMSDDSGCTSTSQQAMNQEQVRSVIVGNTAHSEETNAVAFIDADGSIRAELVAADATKTDTGTWTLDQDGTFCVDWTVTTHGDENCGRFVALGEDEYQWGGHTLTFKPGNTRNL